MTVLNFQVDLMVKLTTQPPWSRIYMYVLLTYLSFTTLLTCSVYEENIIGGKFYVFVRCLIQKAIEMPI